jgi:hypothetical protein
MRTSVNVARYHLIRPAIYLGMPWAIMAFSFAVNLVIFRVFPGRSQLPVQNAAYHATGGVAAIYVFFFIMGVFGTGQSLPFGLALGVSRRSYYTGTALLAVTLAAADGLMLTLLQALERATGNWGNTMHFFQVPYILTGPWYLTWLTSFAGLVLLFGYGMWFGLVYRRWHIFGTLTFIAVQVTLVILVVIGAHYWPPLASHLPSVSAAGLTGLLAALAALLFAGGYATIRRVTV